MDNQVQEEIRCERCGSPLKISKSRRNFGQPIRCWVCYKADWKTANAERISQANKEHYKNNRQYHLDKAQDWRSKNIERHKLSVWHRRLRVKGSSPEYYDAKLAEQHGACALCGKPAGRRRLDQDHDHERRKPRGLLCNGCNRFLGQYEALRPRVTSLEAYLLRYEKENESCITLAL